MSRDKGAREERDVTNTAQLHGLSSFRVPLSGAVASHPNDVVIELGDETIRLECKHREDISRRLWEWLEGADVLTLRRNRHDRLYVVGEVMFYRLIRALERFEAVDR